MKAHWGAIGGAAPVIVFELDTLVTPDTLLRWHRQLIANLETRRVEIAGILPRPDGAWMSQIARNLTDAEDGFLNGSRYLIHDQAVQVARRRGRR